MDKSSSYYLSTCYRPDRVPELPDQQEDPNRSWFTRSSSIRLPWGNTQDVIPTVIMNQPSPKELRTLEAKPHLANLRQNVGLCERMTHERIRFEHPAWPIMAIAFLTIMGKIGFFAFILIAFLIFFVDYFIMGEALVHHYKDIFQINSTIIGICLSIWFIGMFILRVFGRFILKPGVGPLWEINRRTGLVTIWHYPRKKLFRKRGKPMIDTAPFYEFDGYILAGAGPHGTRYFFEFLHRYRKLSAPIGTHLIQFDISEQPILALWDFLQNYMDVSRPLPDIPAFEQYRHLDPVTADHDRRTGRPERYWRDMKNRTFLKKSGDMACKIMQVKGAKTRPNIMEEKVRYVAD